MNIPTHKSMSFPIESSDDDSSSSSSSSLSSNLPLPNEISMNCFALVPRRYYASLSLVSKTIGGFITSPQLYHVRSLLHATESFLYVALRLSLQDHSWYALKPLKNESALVPIPSCPSLPFWGSSVIAIGYEIYVFGGCIDREFTSNVFVIDCRFHTRHFLPSMRVARGWAATGVIDGKVYVIGGCKARSEDWIEVFDLKTKTWESVSGPCHEEVNELTVKSFVMYEMIYVMDLYNSFVYDPKEKKWEIEPELNKGWSVDSCVVGNMLYSLCYKKIKVYNPNLKIWKVLKVVEDLYEFPKGSRLVNYGGKLVVLIDLGLKWNTKITCMEIELEMREGKEIWGKVLRSNRVLCIDNSSRISKCLCVTI